MYLKFTPLPPLLPEYPPLPEHLFKEKPSRIYFPWWEIVFNWINREGGWVDNLVYCLSFRDICDEKGGRRGGQGGRGEREGLYVLHDIT